MAYAIVTVLVLIIDQAVKYWTTVNIRLSETVEFIPGFIELTNIHNTGAAYGILKGMDWLLISLPLIFAVLVFYTLRRNVIGHKFGRWTLLLVMAGGLGNCIDRIINGYVVDMFHFEFIKNYPVFNVADMFISVCGLLFCLYLIFHKKEVKAPEKHTLKTQRSTKGPDYMSQIQKTVAEAKLELSSPDRQTNSGSNAGNPFSEWSSPEANKKDVPRVPEKPVEKPPNNAKSTSDDEFLLDSIIAEFKDK